MAVDEGLGGRAIIVETRRGHGDFDLADGALVLGDAGFELVDAGAAGLSGARRFARLSVNALSFIAVM